MKRTHSWNKGVLLLSWFAGALLLAAFAVSCKPNVSTPKTETFAVTFSAGEHGTVGATVDGKAITSGDAVQKDKTVVFTARPEDGYAIEKWAVNGTTVTNNTTASYSRKVTAKTDVKVFFKSSGDTKYTVRHLQEGVDGTYTKGEEEPKTGTTGKNTEATAKTYTGFITPTTVDQKPIAADGSTVIEIKYARKEITLTFNLAGGAIDGKSDPVSRKGKYGATVTKPAKPKKDGYTFSGWNPKLHNEFPAEDKTYTAQWAREGDYTITYNLNDGTDNGGNPVSYNVETATITLKPAGRKGYDFIGWYEKADFSSSPVTQIVKGSMGNKTFWAKWEPKTDTKYTVRHLLEGLDGTYTKHDEEPKTGTTGKNTEAQPKTYIGFITPTVDQKPIKGDGSTVIEIKYARKEITLTFELNGGNINGKTDSVTVKGKYEAAVTKPTDLKKVGYTFSGWKPELPEKFPVEDKTYTAQWAREGDYTITYNLNDGTNHSGSPQSYNVETPTIELKKASRTGYTFKGWYSNEACTGTSVEKIEKGSTGNKTFWAKWEPKTDTRYTVKHFKEKVTGGYDGVQAEIETLTGTTGNNTEATAKTYTGFITPTVDQKPIKGDGSTVIEIKYVRKEITLTFNLAGGAIDGKSDPVSRKGKYEAAVTKPAKPDRVGYTFSGWNPQLPDKFPAENATYTAQWAKLHFVTFAVEGTPPNGTLTATLDGKPFTNGDVAEGKTVEFTASPSSSNYGVKTWTIFGSSFIDGTGLEGSTTARVKITANTHVRVGFIPLPGKYIPVSFGENGTGLKNHLYNGGNAASDGIYYIEVTGLTTSDVKGVDGSNPSPLGKIIRDNQYRKIALKLGAIHGLTDMSWCFSGCSLTQAPEIPNSVTDMSWCFYECRNLTQAPEIPNSVTNMSGCFSECTSLTQAPEIPNSVTDMSSCFSGCTRLTQAPVIPNSVTNMSGCFYECRNLTQAPEIPNSVTNMSSCFFRCSLTQAPEIPNSVTDMSGCFAYCGSLTQAPVIPNSVTNMSKCFYNCERLTSVTLKCNFPSSNDSWKFSSAFYNCYKLGANSIKVPADQLQTYKDNVHNMGTWPGAFVADN